MDRSRATTLLALVLMELLLDAVQAQFIGGGGGGGSGPVIIPGFGGGGGGQGGGRVPRPGEN